MNIPTSLCKGFFKDAGVRSSPNAIIEFRKRLELAGKDIAKKAAENCKGRNRKTVETEDFDDRVSYEEKDEEEKEKTEEDTEED